MKTRTIIKILLLILFWPAVLSFGQSDTLQYNSGENGYQIDGKFRDRNMAWYLYAKGSLINLRGDLGAKYGAGVAVEHKLLNSHSIGAGVNLMVVDEDPFTRYYAKRVSLELELGYRFYHNLISRMSVGRTGNNFSANYFLISPYISFQYEPYKREGYHWDFNSGTWEIEYKSIIKADPGIRFGYGIQRTFGKHMNFDMNGGIQIHRVPYLRDPSTLLYIQFKIGYILK